MAKARVTVTLVKEFEINPQHYPDGLTLQQIIDLEVEIVQDPIHLADMVGNGDFDKVEAKGEMVDGG